MATSTNPQRRKVKSVKAEELLGKALWREGMHFRKKVQVLRCKTDLCNKTLKISLLVDPSDNTKALSQELVANGWSVISFTKSEVFSDLANCVSIVRTKADIHRCINDKYIRVFEGFAGYGGASFGLRRSGIRHNIVGYSEFDADAIGLYEYNFPNMNNWGDITKIEGSELPDFDLFTGGFPCQPFSTVGKMQGELDTRGTLFGDIIRICEAKQPQYILLENVKGLKGAKHRQTFEKILNELKRIGYDVRYEVLNSKDYDVPQTRERLWIFGYRGELPASFTLMPPKMTLTHRLKDFLDSEPDPLLYRSQQQVARIHEIHHNAPFEVDEPLCYDIYNRKIRTDGLCMTVTPPEHNVIRIVEPMVNNQERFRKLSLDEHFRLMGFVINDKYREIKFPPDQDYTRLGRKAGNGWDVNLVGILLQHIFSQL